MHSNSIRNTEQKNNHRWFFGSILRVGQMYRNEVSILGPTNQIEAYDQSNEIELLNHRPPRFIIPNKLLT